MSAIEHLPEFQQGEHLGLLRFITCGSVDDGKSTLIGRLLHDSKAILADTLHAITATSRRRGQEAPDLSLLTDGLQAEREQGITIDVAHRYFSTGRRKYIIADAPGHEQYTRNMVTAASTADVAVILVDARKGVLTQTRRHAAIAHLLRVRRVVVAVNKMDLVAWSQEVFERIRTDYLDVVRQLNLRAPDFVPLSALAGDMVVEPGTHLDWYRGPTLMAQLEATPDTSRADAGGFRFPVQYVCRPHGDFRGYMGRIEGGAVAVGDEVIALPSGRRSHVVDIQHHGQSLAAAGCGQPVTLLLADDIDLSRGDMLVRPGNEPGIFIRLRADVCWLAETPLDLRRSYLLRHTTREVRARVEALHCRLDLHALQRESCSGLGLNDIGELTLRLSQPVFADAYGDNRNTGAFILIDEATNNTVGAGIILE